MAPFERCTRIEPFDDHLASVRLDGNAIGHEHATPAGTGKRAQVNVLVERVIDGVRLGDRIHPNGIQGGIGLWSIITTLFMRLDPRQAEQFAEHLTTGAGLRRGHPVVMLRNRLLGSQRDQYSTLSGREVLVAIAIKAMERVARWKEPADAVLARRRAPGRTVSGSQLT